MEVDEDERDQDRTIRGLEDIPRQPIDSDKKYKREENDEDIAMTDYDSNKELFLSLAKAEPPRVGINATKRMQERQQVIFFDFCTITQRTIVLTKNPNSHRPEPHSIPQLPLYRGQFLSVTRQMYPP